MLDQLEQRNNVSDVQRKKMYQRWDEELTKKHCDYNMLEKELLSYWMVNQNDPEIIWRLASIIYQKSLNLVDDDEIKSKTLESLRYAQKAIELFAAVSATEKQCFQANKWISITTGKLALLETDLNQKIKYTENFLKYMEKCIQENPDDQMVLFMQGRFQLALTLLGEDEQKLLKEHLPGVPKLNIGDAESKLRRSIELNPEFIDSYITLAYLLVKSHQIDDAKQVIDKGLRLAILNKSDEMIHQELLKIKETLG